MCIVSMVIVAAAEPFWWVALSFSSEAAIDGIVAVYNGFRAFGVHSKL